MAIWWDKTRKEWCWEFEYRTKRYAGRGCKLKSEAVAARAERRKEAIAQASEKIPETPIAMAYGATCNQYLDWSSRRHAPAHVENKKTVFRKLAAFLGNDVSLEALTPLVIHKFLSERPSNNAYNVYRKEISAFFTWVPKHLGYPIPNPCANLEKMPNPKKERNIPTKEEFLRLLAAAGPDEKPLLVVLVHSMARIDEILRLTWQDVNFERSTLALWSRKNRSGEWKERIIPMNPDLHGILLSMWNRRRQEKWVFYNERENDRYLRRPKFMRSLCKKAGIPHYGFHPVRHFVATYLHDIMKIPTGVLSGLLGHENKRTTEIYLHSVDEAHRQAMNQLTGEFLVGDSGWGFSENQGEKGTNRSKE